MYSAGKLKSKWEGPKVIQEVNLSGAIRLRGDIRGKPHVVNGQRLKQYIASQKFIGLVEELYLQSPEKVIAKKYNLPKTPKSVKGNSSVRNYLGKSRNF
jgi:hypothetical protein